MKIEIKANEVIVKDLESNKSYKVIIVLNRGDINESD
jgi:hypothetical protein